MSNPSVAQILISTAAIGGITLLWLELTGKAFHKVVQLSKEMFADKGAEERKRQREIDQEVRRKVSEILERKEEELKRRLTAIAEKVERREEELIRGISETFERGEEEEEEEAAGKTD